MVPLVKKCLLINAPIRYKTEEAAHASTLPYLGATNISWETLHDAETFTVFQGKIKNIMKLNIASFNNIFGEGKYGVRDRAYTQLVSGHYHINTLKVAIATGNPTVFAIAVYV